MQLSGRCWRWGFGSAGQAGLDAGQRPNRLHFPWAGRFDLKLQCLCRCLVVAAAALAAATAATVTTVAYHGFLCRSRFRRHYR
jgi:hypothetical protein